MNKQFFFQMAVKEVSGNSSDSVFIEGFASTPDVDRYRDIVEPSAFKDALELYMKNPALLYQHDPNRPIGNVVSAIVTEKGLKIRAEIKDSDTKEKVLDGRMRALSIGYIPLESTLQHEDGSPFNAESDSPWDSDIIRVIKRLDLVEISIVSTPANGNALFSVAKSVKTYFNEVVTKSFMSKKENKEMENHAEEVKVEEQAQAEENEKAKTESVENEVAPAVTDAPVEEGASTEEAKSDEIADDASDATEEAEKEAESASPDSTEGEDAEVVNAEAQPEAEATEGAEKSIEAISVDEKTAEYLPELVTAGFLVQAKEVGKATVIPKEVLALIRKMSDAYIAECKRTAELEQKLESTPAKKALVAHGQFIEGEEKAEGKEPSAWFKSLFNIR